MVLVNPPGLVQTVVTVPESEVSVINVLVTMNIETFLSVVSDVSSCSRVPSDSVFIESSVWSHSSGDSNSEASSPLIGNAHVSS